MSSDYLHMAPGRVHRLPSSSPAIITPSESSMSFSHKPAPMEKVIKECLERHVSAQLPPYAPITQRRLNFERCRPKFLRQCIAEATGVFFFVFPGLASIAGFTVRGENPAFSSLFQIGWGMGMGVAFAIICCAPVSGGHFNPAITLAMAIWQGFPWKKVPAYIFSQIVGAFFAALMIMGLYWPQIQDLQTSLTAAGKPLVAGGAPASIFCSMPSPNQNHMGYIFMVEFFVDAFIAIVIWAALDPANPFIVPPAIPFVIGLAYANMIWGFGAVTLSTNLARDLGPRIVAAMFYGPEAFTHKGYAPIGMLVNIPATLLAVGFYELVFRDSLMILGKGHSYHEEGEEGLYRHMRKAGVLDEEQGPVPERR